MTPEIEKLLSELKCPEHERFQTLNDEIHFGANPLFLIVKDALRSKKSYSNKILESACAIARCWFEDLAKSGCKQNRLWVDKDCKQCDGECEPYDIAFIRDNQKYAQNWRNLWLAVEGEGKES
jgi:sulfatase maturation enzyme AslB (radical SAM superfamily)